MIVVTVTAAAALILLLLHSTFASATVPVFDFNTHSVVFNIHSVDSITVAVLLLV